MAGMNAAVSPLDSLKPLGRVSGLRVILDGMTAKQVLRERVEELVLTLVVRRLGPVRGDSADDEDGVVVEESRRVEAT